MPNLICVSPECDNSLPKGKRKYCSDTCKWREQKRVHRGVKQNREYIPEEKKVNKSKVATTRRGALYDKFVEEGYALDLINGTMKRNAIAELLGCTPAHISRLLGAYQEDIEQAAQTQNWKKSEATLQAEKDFQDFRDMYFQTEKGELFETADFHKVWIDSIIKAIETGGQQMILSPPRHGKTELLIHFVVWLICTNPNIRIMWVGGNEDIAKNAVSSVLDQLESNERLQEDFCEPGKNFKPDMFISFASPYAGHVAFFLRKPHISFTDTEHAKLGIISFLPFTTIVITPKVFKIDLGEKHLKFNGYMEQCYLQEKYFSPSNKVLKQLRLKPEEKYVIIRLVSWNASHDIGHSGISRTVLEELINEIKKYSKIFISSESELPQELEKYKLQINPTEIHNVLYFSRSFSALCVLKLFLDLPLENEDPPNLTFSPPFILGECLLLFGRYLLCLFTLRSRIYFLD